jgi:hypothetical protein
MKDHDTIHTIEGLVTLLLAFCALIVQLSTQASEVADETPHLNVPIDMFSPCRFRLF